MAVGVDALLAHRRETIGPACVVPRSPLGPHAVRLRPQAASMQEANSHCKALADWLSRQAWVAQVSARPPHVYVQASTAPLIDWVESGLALRLREFTERAPRGRGAVRFADPRSSRTLSLERFRDAAVGHAVRALLEAGGHDMVIDHDPDSPSGVVAVELDADAAAASGAPRMRSLRVEGIDLPQGALRARFGGTASADDIVEMLRPQAASMSADAAEPVEPDDLFRFMLLSCPRTERIPLTDARLQAGCRGAADLVAAKRLTGAAGSAAALTATGDRVLHELAQQIDLFDIVVARAVEALDPCDLMRFVLAVAERVRMAIAALPSSDALRSAARQSMDAAIRLAGIASPPGSELPAIAPHAWHAHTSRSTS